MVSLPIVELVAVVVRGNDVQQEDVLGLEGGVRHASIQHTTVGLPWGRDR